MSSDPTAQELRQLLDRQAIADLGLQYARFVDGRQYERFRGILAKDVILTMHRGDPATNASYHQMTGADEVVKGMSGIEMYLRTQHLVANHWIEFDGDDRASGEVYCTAHHFSKVDGVLTDYVMGIRYQDRYVREADGWKFATRQLGLDWERTAPTGHDELP